MEDASLDDFLGGTELAGGDGDGEAAGTEETGTVGSGRADGVGGPSGGPEHDPTGREEPSATDGRGTGQPETASEVDDTGAFGTFEFAASGAHCADCGDVVERRWRDERGLVCASCKSW